MAIIVYKCNVCDREIELTRNPKGMETVGRCIITDGCRGKLYQVDEKLDFVRGRFPSAVSGLADWSQRKVLYNHTQSVSTSQWTIEHNLGVNPSVQVFVERPIDNTTTLVEIEPDSVEIVDENTLLLNFTRNEAGTAQCVARSSRPVIENVRVETTTAETVPFQITANSEFTIATLDSSTDIDITLSFATPDERIVDVTYTVDSSPSISSPWSDANKIYFHGKTYTVRSFSIVGQVELTNGTVVDTSSMYVKSITTPSGGTARSLTSEEMIILLAADPYEVYDKQTDTFVDPTSIGSTQAAFSFYYENGEVFVYDNLIESVFPNIRQL